MSVPPLAERVIAWQRLHGRHDLPWQADRDAYRIWVSEIMLQQTQVQAVIPYFERFMQRFPDLPSLAAASLDDVLQRWAGLGYYTRARHLHACARTVIADHGGCLPSSAAVLAGLPGIGRSTAAAIAAFAHGERAAILDGNVKRVFCRYFGVDGHPGLSAVNRELWRIAERELPVDGVAAYTQGLMDLGATVCTRARPRCTQCPLAADCVARATDRVALLPAPRPARRIPVRETTMLVLRVGDSVLLERRPPAGIWGGLWSLPESGDGDPAHVLARFGLQVRRMSGLPTLTHAFTHFRLKIRPLLIEVSAAGGADGVGQTWMPLADAADAGLPAPVKVLLAGLPRS